MANSAYGSGLNLDALMVPVQAATVYAAQETSLYLPGILIPTVQVPAGSASAQVAVMGSVTATAISTEGTGASPQDFDTVLPADTKVSIPLELIAARTVLRDLGGIDTNDMGRIMGNAIAASIDTKVSTALAGLTAQESLGVNLLDEMFKAIGTIRANGETGALSCTVSAAAYQGFMSVIGSSAYAGGETQNAAMRSGFIGMVAGVPCYVSSYLNDTNTSLTNTKFAVYSADALRLAMQGGVNVEMERRAAAVGNDIVASAAFGVGLIDATRGVIVQDAV
tara:strand:+ start:1103 stop:1942 length:840 start_codon:yes stop_codon:yes gene_type:complete